MDLARISVLILAKEKHDCEFYLQLIHEQYHHPPSCHCTIEFADALHILTVRNIDCFIAELSDVDHDAITHLNNLAQQEQCCIFISNNKTQTALNLLQHYSHIHVVARKTLTQNKFARVMHAALQFKGRINQNAWFIPNPAMQAQYNEFESVLTAKIKHALSNKQLLALILIGIDYKSQLHSNYNPSFAMLAKNNIDQRITQILPSQATCFTLQPDQLAIVIEDIKNFSYIASLATVIIQQLVQPFKLAAQTLVCYNHIGIALCPIDGNTVPQLLSSAKQALSNAKLCRNTRYAFHHPQLQQVDQSQAQIIADMFYSIQHNHFYLRYQPIFDLNTQAIIGYEALVRWRHPSLDIIGPKQFIPLAEKSGLILSISEWILAKATVEFAHWHSDSPDKLLLVKLVQEQLQDSLLTEHLQQLLQNNNIGFSCLVFEVTPTLLKSMPAPVANELSKLRNSGAKICVKDCDLTIFSLPPKKLRLIDIMKINHSLIQKISIHKDSADSVRAILKTAKQKKITVLASGIETVEQWQFLKKHGCSLAQGYYFCHPLDTADIFYLQKTSAQKHKLG